MVMKYYMQCHRLTSEMSASICHRICGQNLQCSLNILVAIRCLYVSTIRFVFCNFKKLICIQHTGVFYSLPYSLLTLLLGPTDQVRTNFHTQMSFGSSWMSFDHFLKFPVKVGLCSVYNGHSVNSYWSQRLMENWVQWIAETNLSMFTLTL